MKKSKTEKGFAIIEFKDRYGKDCSIQKSSLATEDCIWMGRNEERMHIDPKLAKKIIKILERFIETSEI